MEKVSKLNNSSIGEEIKSWLEFLNFGASNPAKGRVHEGFQKENLIKFIIKKLKQCRKIKRI